MVDIFKYAAELKDISTGVKIPRLLEGKSMVMIFDQPSLRTHSSFQSGFEMLGGNVVFYHADDVGLGVRESLADVAQVISRFHDIAVLRLQNHTELCLFASYATIPVINALTHYLHPTQVLSDLFTITEHFDDPRNTTLGFLKDFTLSFLGDIGNNMARSFVNAPINTLLNVRLVGPPSSFSDANPVRTLTPHFPRKQSKIYNPVSVQKVHEAVRGSHVLYTDAWVSMGDDKHGKGGEDMAPFKVTYDLLRATNVRETIVMHCLPAHRGEEIEDAVMDSRHSVVYTQAENRKFVQTALVVFLLRHAGLTSSVLPSGVDLNVVDCSRTSVLGGLLGGHDDNMVFLGPEGSVRLITEVERTSNSKYGLGEHGEVLPPALGDKRFLDAYRESVAFLRSQPTGAEEKNYTAAQKGNLVVAFSRRKEELRENGMWIPPYSFTVEKITLLATRSTQHATNHAVAAFFGSPWRRALVFVHHGAGNDGPSGVYIGDRSQNSLVRLPNPEGLYNGMLYDNTAHMFPEVTPVSSSKSTQLSRLSAAGTFMGYSGLVPPDRDMVVGILRRMDAGQANVLPFDPRAESTGKERQRTLAASFQAAWTEHVLQHLEPYLGVLATTEGLVLTGGTALNVKTNWQISQRLGVRVWVPPAPGDNNQGLGSAWTVCPPRRMHPTSSVPLQYMGLPVRDGADLANIAKRIGAEWVGVGKESWAVLARVLLEPEAVLGIMYGRQEFGPRALLHRSLVAYPNTNAVRDKMNDLKGRQFYRPTAPTLTAQAAKRLFDAQQVDSPFMSFAPPLTAAACENLPAICHYDHTARPQIVTNRDDPWVYGLLQAVGASRGAGGEEVIINTSFNVKGKPIINLVRDAMGMLCGRPQMDYLFIDGWLFSRKNVMRNNKAVCNDFQ